MNDTSEASGVDREFSVYLLDPGTDEVSRAVWDAALAVLRPSLVVAVIDFFPNESWKDGFFALGTEVHAALDVLREAAVPPRSRRRRTWMAERVDLRTKEIFDAYVCYGYHSIQTYAWRDESAANEAFDWRTADIDNHDSGDAMSFRFNANELREVRLRLRADDIDPIFDKIGEWPVRKRWFQRRKQE